MNNSPDEKRELAQQLSNAIAEFDDVLRTKVTWLSSDRKARILDSAVIKFNSDIDSESGRYERKLRKRKFSAEVIWILERRFRLRQWRRATADIREGFMADYV